MIEKIVIDYLNKNLISVSASAETPVKPPKRYVLVEKTGSSRENMIDTATIAIQSYGESVLEAAKLNETVKNLMFKITEEENVSKCILNSDYNFTDTEFKRYRYQAVFEITYFD